MPAVELPSTSTLLDHLSEFRGRRGYLIDAAHGSGKQIGNHGDALMFDVFRRIAQEAGISWVADPADAEILVVRPNGALLEIYTFPDLLAQELRRLPDIPLVIFPSSAFFPTQDPSHIFEGRSAPVVWVFRERYSFEHIRDSWAPQLEALNVRLVLDHDVVAGGNRYVSSLIGSPVREKHVLIAARIDAEAPTGKPMVKSSKSAAGPSRLKRAIARMLTKTEPGPVRRLGFRVYNRKRSTTASAALLEKLPAAERSAVEAARGKTVALDASAKHLVSYGEYKRLVRDASIVVTDRLHVALPAAIIGKQVILVEAGYHKLTGVYQQSLTALPNITLINAVDDE
ncbi:hypothetical protein AB0E56_16060 [Microbacterium sp. NPDC028030]|uniref:hypothetical protein n=1 Tax=Microbacterium sp. NPDC028030 TaxID=3155124 RepID=UPI0033FFAF88